MMGFDPMLSQGLFLTISAVQEGQYSKCAVRDRIKDRPED